jgi:hypothetical protein
MISSGLTWTMKITNVPQGQLAMQWGINTSLQAFPLASLMTTMNAQINNTNVSINLQDVLPSLLRMNNSRELYRYNSTTPSLPDQVYGSYANAVGATNNPMASIYAGSYDVDQNPRGSFPVQMTVIHASGDPVAYDTSLASSGLTDVWYIQFTTVVTEPLFLSPFTWGDPHTTNSSGLVGINNINLTCNIDTSFKRFISTSIPANQLVGIFPGRVSPTGTTSSNLFESTGVTLGGGVVLNAPTGSTPSLLFRFLSPHPSDVFSVRNVCPYISYPRYITNTVTAQLAPGASTQLTSANLQLNQMPDLFLITVRKSMSLQTPQDTMSQMAIKSISINLNNQSGLLSSASTEQLWRMSRKNASTQSYLEFVGVVAGNIPGPVSVNQLGGMVQNVPSTGSILVINPTDLSIPEYLAPGSLGNFNFQFNVTVTNQYPVAVAPEICVVAVNSGIFVTEMGVSTTYTGILNKEMVETARKGDAVSTADASRMIGGRMQNMTISPQSKHSVRKGKMQSLTS